MKDIFTKSGLFFFFQSTCQFCHEESQILQFMQNYYSVDILPISMDGRPLHNGLFQDFNIPNAQIIDQFKIREVPTIFLVSKDGTSAQRISEGMISADELKNTIILAAKGMNLIDDASFQSTLDIKRQYTIGDDGVITVNKSEMESDPFLLQKIMDQNSKAMTCLRPIRSIISMLAAVLEALMRSNAVFNFKKLLLSLSVCAAILAPTANADNAMRNIFNGMMTSTSPATFSTATRTGIVGGSMSYRTTNVNTNLVSMSFPKASVGCNGIDVFLGPSA